MSARCFALALSAAGFVFGPAHAADDSRYDKLKHCVNAYVALHSEIATSGSESDRALLPVLFDATVVRQRAAVIEGAKFGMSQSAVFSDLRNSFGPYYGKSRTLPTAQQRAEFFAAEVKRCQAWRSSGEKTSYGLGF